MAADHAVVHHEELDRALDRTLGDLDLAVHRATHERPGTGGGLQRGLHQAALRRGPPTPAAGPGLRPHGAPQGVAHLLELPGLTQNVSPRRCHVRNVRHPVQRNFNVRRIEDERRRDNLRDRTSVRVSKQRACDARTAWLTLGPIDGQHELLNLGREHRTVTPAQRRAVTVRDPHCQHPGCRAPARWCDMHHLVEWEHGGTTDTANLVLLCGRHHVAVHEGAKQLVRDPDGTCRVTPGFGDKRYRRQRWARGDPMGEFEGQPSLVRARLMPRTP